MQSRETLKLATYYRLLAILPFIVGVAIVAAGAWFGRPATPKYSLTGDPVRYIEAIRNVPLAVGTVIGLVIWQFGKSVALFRLVGEAADRASVSDEQLRSEVASTVDERIEDATETSGGTVGSAATGRRSRGVDDRSRDRTGEQPQRQRSEQGDEAGPPESSAGETDPIDGTGSTGDASSRASDDDLLGPVEERTEEKGEETIDDDPLGSFEESHRSDEDGRDRSPNGSSEEDDETDDPFGG